MFSVTAHVGEFIILSDSGAFMIFAWVDSISSTGLGPCLEKKMYFCENISVNCVGTNCVYALLFKVSHYFLTLDILYFQILR